MSVEMVCHFWVKSTKSHVSSSHFAPVLSPEVSLDTVCTGDGS